MLYVKNTHNHTGPWYMHLKLTDKDCISALSLISVPDFPIHCTVTQPWNKESKRSDS